ncbi:hypothetical protein GCM10010140_41050 [Streptosporangium pseudovulgare]|uniref:Uncharacterized protein n=1 Tax=Streptosporangium pseudovulgare TaxID=35765 RepID=A0ABQ2R1W8_9ACTN|nr:hypothetical protein GCM10010140_41050 [Streptosporangium pseudovulgare]
MVTAWQPQYSHMRLCSSNGAPGAGPGRRPGLTPHCPAAGPAGQGPWTSFHGSRVIRRSALPNRAARKATTHFADNIRHADPRAEHAYQQAHDRGELHPDAVRILGRGRLRVIRACRRNATPMTPPSTTPDPGHQPLIGSAAALPVLASLRSGAPCHRTPVPSPHPAVARQPNPAVSRGSDDG